VKTFYTYLWLREDGTPYYIGKGHGDRAFSKHRIGSAPPKSQIIVETFPDEMSAFEAEIFLISYYGRIDLGTGCLRNRADGGQGLSGPKPWVRRAMLGNTHGKGKNTGSRAPEVGEKISAKMLGNRNGCGPRRPRSSEHSRKLGAKRRGKKSSAATRQKISTGLKLAYTTGRRTPRKHGRIEIRSDLLCQEMERRGGER
jgi:hypothetical protein